MKEWLTAAEIAEAKLPDMPTTKRGVALKADAEGWDSHPALARSRAGRGGGYEYHFRVLPTHAQVAYMQRNMIVAANDEPAQPVSVQADPLSSRARDQRDARLAIVDAFERFANGLPRLRQASHLQLFCDKYQTGSLAVDAWVKDLVPAVSKRSLLRWLSAKRKGATKALAVDRGASRKGTGVFDLAEGGRLRAFVLALIVEQPHFAAEHVRTLCIDEFGDTVAVGTKRVAMPAIRTFQWALKALKTEHNVLIAKITNPDRYRSHMKARGTGMLRHISEPNSLWMIDASPVDALCVDGRHQIYIAIDVATRRIVITVSKTARASAVGLMIRKAAKAWGIPHQIKTDNGSDFVAEATQRLFRSLDIEPLLSQKYSPTEKAHVERVIGTFQRKVGPMLPGFIGHNVSDRKAIEERKSFAARLGTTDAQAFGVQLTSAELQAKIDEWVQYAYEQTEHSGLGMSPFSAAAASTVQPRMVSERALDVLLMPVAGKNGQRVVTAQGIRIDGYYYGVTNILPRTPVFVRQDPADMGKVYAFSQDGAEYLGEGTCPELAGISGADFWKAVREAHADILREGGKWMEAERRRIAKGPAFIDRYLRVKKAQASNVIAMPKRPVDHSTPQIAAALDAIATSPAPATPMDARTRAEQDRLIAAFDAQADMAASERINAKVAERVEEHRAAREASLADNVVALPETALDRYRRAVVIRRDMEAGRDVDQRDVFWLGQYETTAEFQGQKVVHDDYGDVYLGL